MGPDLLGKIRSAGTTKIVGFFFFLLFFLLFLLFLYHIFVVTVQEIACSARYGENKTQNPKQTNKGNFGRQ